MKALKYFFYSLMLFYCGCSDATSKGDTQSLSCPQVFSTENSIPANWITVGNIPKEKFQLRTIGIIDSDTSDIPNRNFSEEIIDEWESLKDQSQATVAYDGSQENMMLKCVYAKSAAEDSDHNIKNMVLLIPLPVKKSVTCLAVRRDVDPTHEISCKVK